LVLIDKIKNEIEKLHITKFIPINYTYMFKKKIKKCNYFYLNQSPFYPNLPNFSEKVDKEVFEGYTVTYAALQLAVYMGFNEIYLLGIDFNYSIVRNSKGQVIKNDSVKDYFTNEINNEGINLPNLDYSYLAYKSAKKYCDKNKIKIYYATREGKLDVFEKVHFDELFEKK